jgi:hypothetical protein
MKRLEIKTLCRAAGIDVIREAAAAWLHQGGQSNGKKPTKTTLVTELAAAMEDEVRVVERLEGLPRRLADLLESFLTESGVAVSVQELFREQNRNFKSRFELEACLAALQREGFLFETTDRKWTDFDGPGFVVPRELADCIADHRARTRRALKDVLTLQGHLDARYFRQRAEKEPARQGAGSVKDGSSYARKIYKLYVMDSAIEQRRSKLPESVGNLFIQSLTRHGGISDWQALEQELGRDELPDIELTRKCLEDGMLGTVGPLELARFGIQPIDEAVVIFHEVALTVLRSHEESEPIQADTTLQCGGNLATNTCRFLRELSQNKVLFTAEGELFKASSKRIAGLLLPVPGPFLPAESQLELIYRFCLLRRLIDRRGERALRPTAAGQKFDRSSLLEQVKLLLLHCVEDRTLAGEPFHHVRLRRVLLRLLKRGTPLMWHELMLLPLLARNAYLSQLDGAQAEEFFAARFAGGGYTPTESLQQMSFNLLTWVKRRLYPLGLVDIGTAHGRPVALRLSQLGADLLEAEPAAKVGGTRSSLLVNPDFEVVLFPGDDEHEAVHLLDRFSQRVKSDHVHQFRLTQESVWAGVEEGTDIEQFLQELQDRAKAPVPQNVLYSLEEWGNQKSR